MNKKCTKCWTEVLPRSAVLQSMNSVFKLKCYRSPRSRSGRKNEMYSWFLYTVIITRQNVAGPSAGPSSNLNPQSLLQNQFISLAQSHQNCTQHIQIGKMNIYHGKYEEPPSSTRKRRRIIESRMIATKRQSESIACERADYYFWNINCRFANHCY